MAARTPIQAKAVWARVSASAVLSRHHWQRMGCPNWAVCWLQDDEAPPALGVLGQTSIPCYKALDVLAAVPSEGGYCWAGIFNLPGACVPAEATPLDMTDTENVARYNSGPDRLPGVGFGRNLTVWTCTTFQEDTNDHDSQV